MGSICSAKRCFFKSRLKRLDSTAGSRNESGRGSLFGPFKHIVYRCLHGLAPAYLSVEHQGPAVETATTVMVVGHVSRPDVEPVHCRRPRFPNCRCTSLEYSVAGRSFIQLFCQLSSVGSRPSFSHEASLTDTTA